MGTKTNPGAYDCYQNALPDEPLFTILARDPDFCRLVNKWANRRMMNIRCGLNSEKDIPMIIEAKNCAVAGQIWRRENNGIWRKQ